MLTVRRVAALGAAAVAGVLPAGAVAARHPNDPLLGRQVHLRQTDVPSAWKLSVGGRVTVAVIDTGVDMGHPDLAGNIWTNRREIPGNHVDDDHNGYVDDRNGWDFVDNDPWASDENGHGTLVAGILAARGDNGRGVSGVAQRAQIMPLRVADRRGSSTFATVARAVRYAADNGARVANISMSPLADPGSDLPKAIAYAAQRGMLVVVIAGNDGIDLGAKPRYPACATDVNVVTVGALDPFGRLAPWSNFGSCVDIFAPGTNVFATTLGGGYGISSGTSFAAPQVAGAAVLALARRPDLSVAQLAAAIKSRGRIARAGVTVGRLDVGALVRSVG